MSESFFGQVDRIRYEGPETDNPLAFRWYDEGRIVRGRTMADHLRFAVCYWHSFNWSGSDVFGGGTFDRPWLTGGDPLGRAKEKARAAFEFLEKLGAKYFTFHDRDVAPEGSNLAETNVLLDKMVDTLAAEMERTRVQLLWGTANLFSHPRYLAGAATNPDPEVFAYAGAQVKKALEVTHRLGGANYVLWGGREGYDSLLHTDLRRELDQLGRFLTLVAEHKHRIGFRGTLLIEPKPMEPTKHQYDFDVASVHAFLQKYGLTSEYRVNIEANHATLAGHSFHHEVAYAAAHGIFGSIDVNRGDPQLGWDTDQFPNDVGELALVWCSILGSGGFSTGGFNFDAKLRRQSIARDDLFHGHVGGIDCLAKALLVADRMLDDPRLASAVPQRYAGWDGELGRSIRDGRVSLADLAELVESRALEPRPRSGRQEQLENLLQRHLFATERPR